jgi:hypothetical protein
MKVRARKKKSAMKEKFLRSEPMLTDRIHVSDLRNVIDGAEKNSAKCVVGREIEGRTA